MNLHEFSPDNFEQAETRFPGLDAGILQRHHAEGHICAGQQARCSWWSKDAPQRAGEQTGVIGHFSASDPEAACAVIERACMRLREQGCTEVFGPMDGNTWRRYRWVTDRGDGRPFLMEPWNPPEWPAWWDAAGFAPWEVYQSARVGDLGRRDERYAKLESRLRDEGVVIRTLDMTRWDADLRAIYDVSVESFARNVLYTPLPEADFTKQYAAYRDKIRPEFVLLAMHGERCAGFAFCLPDWSQAQRGEKVDTLIVKTVAVRSGRAYAGLGGLLAEQAQLRAQAAGFTSAIHALALENNPVTNITARYAQVMRRYTLYRKDLKS